ncbi:MAG: hypothetical protein M1371_05275 [Actinobacteria bacterium]|nr:hypothetical protein [Actinomycetota bacterium]
MIITYSKNLVPIRLTEERWNHIIQRHPEMENQREKAIETVSNPDLIYSGDFGELLAVRFYSEIPLTSKYLIIAYKETSAEYGFIVTAYFTNTLLQSWASRANAAKYISKIGFD